MPRPWDGAGLPAPAFTLDHPPAHLTTSKFAHNHAAAQVITSMSLPCEPDFIVLVASTTLPQAPGGRLQGARRMSMRIRRINAYFTGTGGRGRRVAIRGKGGGKEGKGATRWGAGSGTYSQCLLAGGRGIGGGPGKRSDDDDLNAPHGPGTA